MNARTGDVRRVLWRQRIVECAGKAFKLKLRLRPQKLYSQSEHKSKQAKNKCLRVTTLPIDPIKSKTQLRLFWGWRQKK